MAKRKPHRRNDKAIAVLAINIRRVRIAKSITIQQLADLIDVDYSQISRIERGLVNPSVSIIFDIANALKVEPSDLLKNDNS